MLRLNNKGWGLPSMLGLLGVLLGALFVVVIMSNRFSHLLGYTTKSNSYETNNMIIESPPNTEIKISDDKENFYEYEQLIIMAAKDYRNVYYKDINDDVKFYININNLDINEEIVHSCSGYVKITNDSEIPFIKCGDYQTEGYLKELDN